MIIKGYDTEKIYNYDEIRKNPPKLYKCYDFEENDIVWYFATRLSSSYSSWLKVTNINHGFVLVRGQIIIDANNGKRIIKILKDSEKKWKKPLGKERGEQAIDFLKASNYFDYVI